MSQVKGVVRKLFTKEFGKKTFHSFTLEGDERFFGTGVVKHKDINVGNTIMFEADKNEKGYWQADTKTVERLAQAAPAQTNADVPAPSRGVDWAAKDRVIECQSRRNSAIAMASFLLDNGGVKISSKKPEEIYDTLVDLVHEWEDTFEKENENARQGKPIREVGEEAQPNDVPEPSAEDQPWDESN